jgi:hypothetical protein
MMERACRRNTSPVTPPPWRHRMRGRWSVSSGFGVWPREMSAIMGRLSRSMRRSFVRREDDKQGRVRAREIWKLKIKDEAAGNLQLAILG